jgi:DNA ligase 1
VLLQLVAEASAAVAAQSSRSIKITTLAELLTQADEPAVVVSWLSGELPQRQIGVGYAALRSIPDPAADASLTVRSVDETFDLIKSSTGSGSQARRRELLMSVFSAATDVEQAFLRGLLSGDLRQGALAGVMTAAIAKASGRPLDEVRRAAMLRGDLAAVAAAALGGEEGALAEFTLQVGRPIGPMLAQTASDTADALQKLGGVAAFEWKLDGARVQIHRDGDDVSIYTRSLDDVTARLPEIVEAALALPAQNLILDGEAIALRPDGRPQPFQVTASRLGSKQGSTPLTAMIFDLLHLDGHDLLDDSAEHRRSVLEAIVPEHLRTPRLVTDNADRAKEFLDAAIARGHEGVVAKSLTAPYEAGRRGAGWLKIKPVHTLDLVVLAVEHGSGRRRGTLSNIHLGARNPDGEYVMLGKTFKGMTDAMLAWQTERFTELATGPTDGWVVELRPEQVVEIAFDGVQRSPRYPGGVALRFARVIRYRDDKPASEADTIDTVRSFLPR